MKLKDLLDSWERNAKAMRTPKHYSVRLSLPDAAKLAALRDMYPGRSEEELITDLLSAALDEIQAVFPYVPGSRIVAEDDQGDPIYEDTGLTPRFHRLYEQHLSQMRRDMGS